jgi:hypothetical protein
MSRIGGREVEKGKQPIVTTDTGSTALSKTYQGNAPFYLESISFDAGATPTTSEDFTVTLGAYAGTVYDTVLLAVDLATESARYLYWHPNLLCTAGDTISVTFTNTDGNTYGLRIVTRMA